MTRPSDAELRKAVLEFAQADEAMLKYERSHVGSPTFIRLFPQRNQLWQRRVKATSAVLALGKALATAKKAGKR